MRQQNATAGIRHRPSGWSGATRSGPGRRPVEAASAAHAALGEEEQHRERDQHERERGGRCPVEQRSILEVDRPGQRVVVHQRDDAEVREHVEGDEERAGAERGAQGGEGDAPEGGRAGAAKAARRLLERRVEVPQRRRREQEHVRIRRERQRQERSPVAAELGQLAAQGVREEPARAERTEEAERGHVARDHEREGGQDGPGSAPRKVGSGNEPRERHAYEQRRDHDPDHQQAGLDDELERALLEDDPPRIAARRSDDEVDEREEQQRRDAEPRDGERDRGAARPPAGHVV